MPVTDLGGKTVMPVTDLGGAVTIAMFNDLDGLLIGAGTRRPYPRGLRRRRLRVQASRWPGFRSSDRTRRGRSSSACLFLRIRRPPIPALFPYATLFRSKQ